MTKLFVNIDHVATVRNQRGTKYPDILTAAMICEENGAEGITAHLREDRRHIKDIDVEILKKNVKVFNLEMAATDEMIKIASKIKPAMTCIVPEKREELTTEGGLNVIKYENKLRDLITELQSKKGIEVSLFIEPDFKQIEVSKKIGAHAVEIHTGTYANTLDKEEVARIIDSINYATSLGLKCNLGHGLDYENINPFLGNNKISEFNIGHSIISYAVIYGLSKAVKDMVKLIK